MNHDRSAPPQASGDSRRPHASIRTSSGLPPARHGPPVRPARSERRPMSSGGFSLDPRNGDLSRQEPARSHSPISVASSSSTEGERRPANPPQRPPRQLHNVLAAFADAGHRSRKRADTMASASSARSRRTAAGKENYPSSPEFQDIDKILKHLEEGWPMVLSDDDHEEFDVVTLTLSLLDDQRALGTFLDRETELKNALTVLTEGHYKPLDASVGAYNLAGTSLNGAQKEVGSLRHDLEGVKDVLARRAKELAQMEMRRDECAEAERILDTMSVPRRSHVLSRRSNR
jgi:Sec8 exocyst complex component specific domain